MIQDEQQFRTSLERLVKIYALRDRAEVEPHWDEEQRGSQVFQENAALQRLRREIAAFLAKQPEENFSSPMLDKHNALCESWEHEEVMSSSAPQPELARAA